LDYLVGQYSAEIIDHARTRSLCPAAEASSAPGDLLFSENNGLDQPAIVGNSMNNRFLQKVQDIFAFSLAVQYQSFHYL
jgi:hypothetical protein